MVPYVIPNTICYTPNIRWLPIYITNTPTSGRVWSIYIYLCVYIYINIYKYYIWSKKSESFWLFLFYVYNSELQSKNSQASRAKFWPKPRHHTFDSVSIKATCMICPRFVQPASGSPGCSKALAGCWILVAETIQQSWSVIRVLLGCNMLKLPSE